LKASDSYVNPRSYLFVPADNADRLSKSVSRGADALIVDLEDGVAPSNKVEARANAIAWLGGVETSAEIWVRINEDSIVEDLNAIVHPKVLGIVASKSSSAKYIEYIASQLTEIENSKGITNKLEIFPLVESAEGILNLSEIAKSSRVTRLMLGEQDLRADLALPRVSDGQVLDLARNLAIFACAAAGITAPIASVGVDFTDLSKFEESTIAFQRRGYFGRACIHPAQLEIANRIFAPSEEDIAWARDVLERLEAAHGGATVDSQGKMIDEAVAKRARRIL
jgi:citrate lyase subunit beta/citryl-CoA lyase